MAAVDIAQVEQNIAKNLDEFSHHLGMMFQIKDDLLDVYGMNQNLAKSRQ